MAQRKLLSNFPFKPFDAAGEYVRSGGLSEFRGDAVRNAGVTVFASAAGLAIQVIGTVLLARLVTPQDFGVVTMVTTFSLLLMNFGLNGFTEAILQREQINHNLISNLFWVNAAVGAALTVGF